MSICCTYWVIQKYVHISFTILVRKICAHFWLIQYVCYFLFLLKSYKDCGWSSKKVSSHARGKGSSTPVIAIDRTCSPSILNASRTWLYIMLWRGWSFPPFLRFWFIRSLRLTIRCHGTHEHARQPGLQYSQGWVVEQRPRGVTLTSGVHLAEIRVSSWDPIFIFPFFNFQIYFFVNLVKWDPGQKS